MRKKNTKEKEKSSLFLRTAAYGRCSHQEQKLHGYSVQHQVAALQKYADDNGIIINEWYIDEAKSSSKDQNKRTEFLRMMKDAEEGKIDLIIFTKLDRYFRDIRTFYRYEDKLAEHGVKWKATEESFDNYTQKGKEMLHFRIVYAQMESERTGERIDFSFKNMVREKKPITGSQPFGYKIGGEGRNKRVIKDPEVEPIINEIYDHYEACRSKRATTKYITELFGRQVSYKRITKVLTNPYYTGEYRGVEDYAPPYISKERYNRIQHIIKSNVRQTKRNLTYYFSGLVYCDDCGCRCPGNTSNSSEKNVYKNYRCGRFINYNACKNGRNYSEIRLEKYILDHIVEEMEKYEVAVKVAEEKRSKPKASTKKLKEKIKRIQRMYKDGFMQYDDFTAEYKELEAKIEAIEAEQQRTEVRDLTPIKALFEAGFKEIYSTLSDEEKAALWGKALREIRVDHTGKIGLFF